jgi:hypothetical protein
MRCTCGRMTNAPARYHCRPDRPPRQPGATATNHPNSHPLAPTISVPTEQRSYVNLLLAGRKYVHAAQSICDDIRTPVYTRVYVCEETFVSRRNSNANRTDGVISPFLPVARVVRAVDAKACIDLCRDFDREFLFAARIVCMLIEWDCWSRGLIVLRGIICYTAR